MSFEFFVNGRPRGQLATIYGWSELVDELELGEVPSEIAEFIERGWSDNPVLLREQLSSVMENMDHLSDGSRKIIEGFIEKMPKKGIVSIGM